MQGSNSATSRYRGKNKSRTRNVEDRTSRRRARGQDAALGRGEVAHEWYKELQGEVIDINSMALDRLEERRETCRL